MGGFQQFKDCIHSKTNLNSEHIDPLLNIFSLQNLNVQDHLFEVGKENKIIGFVCEGILSSYVLDTDGNENILFFSMENDLIIGNLSPEMKCSFSKQSLTKSIVLTANYKEYLEYINKEQKLLAFHNDFLENIHNKIKGRISKDFFSNAQKKYETFLTDYPGLLNRIPHYHIANYLGITPTQLSRIRKSFFR
ncbi:MAG: hypothetical protein C0597_13205 [Marinilabiliales bacterium]|nr:MAG: hypothetical protein C0597_13205 [Marinilabiliales bacterium]